MCVTPRWSSWRSCAIVAWIFAADLEAGAVGAHRHLPAPRSRRCSAFPRCRVAAGPLLALQRVGVVLLHADQLGVRAPCRARASGSPRRAAVGLGQRFRLRLSPALRRWSRRAFDGDDVALADVPRPRAASSRGSSASAWPGMPSRSRWWISPVCVDSQDGGEVLLLPPSDSPSFRDASLAQSRRGRLPVLATAHGLPKAFNCGVGSTISNGRRSAVVPSSRYRHLRHHVCRPARHRTARRRRRRCRRRALRACTSRA